MGFIDQSVCHWRVPGDVALALSYPILWYRMYSVGLAGVSVETQLLHFLTFFFRYICYPSEIFGISYYNSAAKLWYITCSALTLTFLLIRQRSSLNLKPTHLIQSWTSHILVISTIIIAFPIVVLSHEDHGVVLGHSWDGTLVYSSTSILLKEAPWNTSQFVSVVTMIPQLVMLFKGAGAQPSIALNGNEEDRKSARVVAGVDVLMWTYVMSVAAFRTFYILHWIWRWNTEHYLDPIAQFCAVLQLVIIYGFILAIIIKGSRSNKQFSPESGFATGVGKQVSAGTEIFDNDVKKQVVPTIVVTDVA